MHAHMYMHTINYFEEIAPGRKMVQFGAPDLLHPVQFLHSMKKITINLVNQIKYTYTKLICRTQQ